MSDPVINYGSAYFLRNKAEKTDFVSAKNRYSGGCDCLAGLDEGVTKWTVIKVTGIGSSPQDGDVLKLRDETSGQYLSVAGGTVTMTANADGQDTQFEVSAKVSGPITTGDSVVLKSKNWDGRRLEDRVYSSGRHVMDTTDSSGDHKRWYFLTKLS